MNGFTATLEISLSAASLSLIILGLVLILINHTIDKWTRRFFIVFLTILALYVVSNLTQLNIYYYADGSVSSQVPLFFESLFSSLLLPLLALYLLHCCGEPYRKSRVLCIVGILWLAYFVLLVVTQFTGFIYYFTPDYVYHRGTWYPLLLLPPILISVTILISVIRRKKVLSSRQFAAFLIYVILPAAGMLVQTFVYGISFIVIFTSLAGAAMLMFIAGEQVERYTEQQVENERLYANTMVLQMRPHYIYNAMMSIYYLVDRDPEKARQVILDFTNYLRKNFSALDKKDMIPFTDELEHARAYLAVEKARFEDNLFVEYNVSYTQFRLPPLTLQPIVENAVKHGLDPELEPLHIRIYTLETEHGAEITVEDTGPGFDSSAGDEPHGALENIKSRLAMMCGGTLEITPREGGGTVVKIKM